MTYSGAKKEGLPIRVDLTYAHAPTASPECRTALNGLKSGAAIADSVYRNDAESFRVALAAVKFWAMRRNIYGSVVGFLGGISTAVMTARKVSLNLISKDPSLEIIKCNLQQALQGGKEIHSRRDSDRVHGDVLHVELGDCPRGTALEGCRRARRGERKVSHDSATFCQIETVSPSVETSCG